MNGDDTNNDENMEINRQQLDGLELVYSLVFFVRFRKKFSYPMFKLTAKLHHEWDAVECTKSGVYFLVFCNKHSWLNGKTVNIAVQLRGSGASSQTVLKQCYFNDSQREDDDGLSIVTRFNILPKTKSFPE
jgi:hypothetical protein